MTATLKQIVNSLQVPTNSKLTMAELRAKALQQLGVGPAPSTPQEADSGVEETPVITQPNEGT